MARAEASAAVSVERFFQFALLGLVASGYLAVAGSGYLDTPTAVVTAAGMAFRALLICGVVRLEISSRFSTIVTLAYMAFFGVDYAWLSRDFLNATVHLVFFLAVMKILTARTGRDHLYTAAIAFLELLAAAILSVNLNFFVFLALFLLFAIAALTSGEIRREVLKNPGAARARPRRFHPRLASLSVTITLGILALTAGLFFLLPRTADAALARLMAGRLHLPGFANQITLGETGEIQTSSRPVMHVRIFSTEKPRVWRWRGGALADFDGKRWSVSGPREQIVSVPDGHIELAGPGRPQGHRINYHVAYDSLDTDTLFFAGTPEQIAVWQPRLLRGEADTWRLGHAPPPSFQYDAYSLLEDPPELSPPPFEPPVLPLAMRERNLQLPQLDARIAPLALRMAEGAVADLARARQLERHLRRDYVYTLELPQRDLSDPLADFLFTRRQGYCEYFASAMTVMLRTLGIPARIVTGFVGGEYNPLTELWVVRASDAHSWVEAWVGGRGWTSFDPTPPDSGRTGLALFTQMGLYLDAARTFWNDWVVSYDMSRQGVLADRVEQGARRTGLRWSGTLDMLQSGWRTYGAGALRRYGPRAAVALGLGVCLWLAGPPLLRLARIRRRVQRLRRGEAGVGDATLLYQRMLALLQRRGYRKPAWYTPLEFARSLPRTPLGERVAEFTASYNALRFGGHRDAAIRLSVLLEELEHQPW